MALGKPGPVEDHAMSAGAPEDRGKEAGSGTVQRLMGDPLRVYAPGEERLPEAIKSARFAETAFGVRVPREDRAPSGATRVAEGETPWKTTEPRRGHLREAQFINHRQTLSQEMVSITRDLDSSGQPISFALDTWKPPHRPPCDPMVGHFCRVELLDPNRHAAHLYDANALDTEGRIWTYLPYGPFETLENYLGWMNDYCRGSDPLFHAIVDNTTGKAVGVASYLRITPASGSIEVGHINYSPLLQRTPAATEAMYLMMKRAFELGYRRYEWKCNALNAKSRAAAQRLGLSFEGVFRQATVYKGRNRDTAWYAAIDQEWPALKDAFLRWLNPTNFNERGEQRIRLTDLTAPILEQRG